MKVEKVLRAAPDEFFGVIEHSLRYEIEKYGGKAAGTYELCEGFSYDKKIRYKKKEYQMLTELKSFRPPLSYRVLMKSDMGNASVSYEILPTGEDQIRVIYREDTCDENGNTNTSFGRELFGKLQAGRVRRRLSRIENYIRSQQME